jgi:hypothetical protein
VAVILSTYGTFLMGHMQWACHTLDVGSGGRRYSAAEVLESVQSIVFCYGTVCALCRAVRDLETESVTIFEPFVAASCVALLLMAC